MIHAFTLFESVMLKRIMIKQMNILIRKIKSTILRQEHSTDILLDIRLKSFSTYENI